jgi:phospholipase C
MGQIKHVVHVMLENRSFDAVLGWLYDPTTLPDGKYFRGLAFEGGAKIGSIPTPSEASTAGKNSGAKGGAFRFSPHGVVDPSSKSQSVQAKIYDPTSNSMPDSEIRQWAHFPPENPGEPHEHVSAQLYAPEPVIWANDPQMKGFSMDYMALHKDSKKISTDTIVTSLPQQLLPAITSLAQAYGVCDEWFASVPSQTWANRLFAYTASSSDIVNNEDAKSGYKGTARHLTQFSAPTIMEHMDYWHRATKRDQLAVPTVSDRLESEWSWKVYSHQRGADMVHTLFYKLMSSEAAKDVYVPFETLASDAAAGLLPAYSIVEPLYLPAKVRGEVLLHNDHHPSELVEAGEAYFNRPPLWAADTLVLDIFEALFGPKADQAHAEATLLIITYDEHGGCYDHVTPPVAQNPHAGASAVTDANFAFQRYGVRVPAIFISPHIAPQTILHKPKDSPFPFDHTSLIHSIRDRWQVHQQPTPPLTHRDAVAPTFWHVLSTSTAQSNEAEFRAIQARNQRVPDLIASCRLKHQKLQDQYGTAKKKRDSNWKHWFSDLGRSMITYAAASLMPLGKYLAPRTGRKGLGEVEIDWERAAHLVMNSDHEAYTRDPPSSSLSVVGKPLEIDWSTDEEAKAQLQNEGGVKRALLVGIEDPFALLQGPHNDVQLIEQLLTTQFGFSSSNIVTLKDAERGPILEQFQNFAKKSLPDDTFVFYYSGHGTEFFDEDKEKWRQAILPIGALTKDDALIEKSILDHEIGALLDTFITKNVTLIFDSCHSGDMTRSPTAVVSTKAHPKSVNLKRHGTSARQTWTSQNEFLGKYIVLSACRDNEVASEYPFEVENPQKSNDLASSSASNSSTASSASDRKVEVYHGALTWHLYQILSNKLVKGEDLEILTWRALVAQIRSKMASFVDERGGVAFNQHVQLEGLRDWVVFGRESRAQPPAVGVSQSEGSLITLDAGRLHGVALDSLWVTKDMQSGREYELKVVELVDSGLYAGIQANCICTAQEVTSSVVYPNGQPPLKNIPKSPSEQAPPSDASIELPRLSIHTDFHYAVCVAVPKTHLPKLCLQDSAGEIDLSKFALEYPTFFTLISDETQADLIVHHTKTFTKVTIPSRQASGYFTSGDWDSLFSDISRICRYLQMSKPVSNVPTIFRRNVGLTIGQNPVFKRDLTSPLIFRNGDLVVCNLRNDSFNDLYFTLLCFGPDFSIDQRWPIEGTMSAVTSRSNAETGIRMITPPSALRDQLGCAKVTLRFILTSKPADFWTLLQPAVDLSPEKRLRGSRGAENPGRAVNEGMGGCQVLDVVCIIQPRHLEEAIQYGLMHQSQWNSPFVWVDFERLRQQLLVDSSPPSTPTTPTSPSLAPSPPSNKLEFALPQSPKVASSKIVLPPNDILIIFLTAGDTPAKESWTFDSNRYTNDTTIRSTMWRLMMTKLVGTSGKAPAFTSGHIPLLNSEFDVSQLSKSISMAKGKVVLVALGTAGTAAKKALLDLDSKSASKCIGIVFENTIHHRPTYITHAGILSSFPLWREAASNDAIEKWFQYIQHIDSDFIQRHSSLMTRSLVTNVPSSLFSEDSLDWTSKKSNHKTYRVEATNYFELALPDDSQSPQYGFLLQALSDILGLSAEIPAQ